MLGLICDLRQFAMKALWHAACFFFQVVQWLIRFMKTWECPTVNRQDNWQE